MEEVNLGWHLSHVDFWSGIHDSTHLFIQFIHAIFLLLDFFVHFLLTFVIISLLLCLLCEVSVNKVVEVEC